MNTIGQKEIRTQENVIVFFKEELGYDYLGDWHHRQDNSNIEKALLTNWLKRHGYSDQIISRVLFELNKAATLAGSQTLYGANREVYNLLRYGVKVRPSADKKSDTVWLIDWKNPRNNDFSIAEEVTVAGKNTKRPDIVLYVNGIAVGVLELKRSTVSIAEGIRQNLDNQKETFIRPFFATAQLLMAGNDAEGLRYGTIETPEKQWLHWKETERDPETTDNPLLSELGQFCEKARLLEVLRDFIVFDAGVKKICRHNQFFGVKAAQAYVKRREGGLIWHTQGSGKSLTMVWLARWIRENGNARVLIITDRTELDEQIEMVFNGVGEDIYRTKNGADLVRSLSDPRESLICSLVHKFGRSGEMSDADVETYIDDIQRNRSDVLQPSGEFFVFVDECHRTQSGKLHKAMKTLLPEAIFIGFTGTPLLKSDKPRSLETFGRYIHTYKYDEAVADKVVLDLRYEARDIDQQVTSQRRLDQLFELKTQGLTDIAKAQLKKRWGTMRRVFSSTDRLNKIVADIEFDMERYPRLKSGRGNAMLVSDSIYSACRLFELFQRTELAGKCAIVTSYKPTPNSIKGEETGEGLTERLLKNEIYRKMLAAHFNQSEDESAGKVELFEQEVKGRFVKEPGQMKLLIVVDKLLTGFDAPSATYLYIDKHMQDHGLFQAICRINRLDGEDKEYGYVIDYKDLFRSLEKSIKDYTGEVFADYDKEDVAGLLKDRIEQGSERLKETREQIKTFCDQVDPPRDQDAYRRFFCAAESGNDAQLEANKLRRVTLYKRIGAFLRAYANLANEMGDAGYSDTESQQIKAEATYYENLRQEIQLASGDYVDLKAYEPAMRHLLDTYIRAEESQTLSAFEDMTLVELIVEQGDVALNQLPESVRNNETATAETIENNVRQVIVEKTPENPKYYEELSEVLDTLIRRRRQEAIEYEAYLARILDLTEKISQSETQGAYPPEIRSQAQRALFDNIVPDVSGLQETDNARKAQMALTLDETILRIRRDDWRGHTLKEREVRRAIEKVVQAELGDNAIDIDALFELVKNQDEY
ncbi:restriction endonuclease subunit R [Candidatus Poribacteria bacterium]|nr:MAG: restriction endonuclease subunit R [Candidatus Poribacteria bacterium]